ncbi:MAG: heparinase II/III family protein [Hyphomicrobiaceae bacterium]|nr:heparinase II/III family protein [Hyphomicrobiaceae bacterium]
MRSPLLRWRYKGDPIEQLLLMPQDLRTGDPSFASEIYHGHFGLAGAVALLETENPFVVPPPSAAWERELHGFGWLRHLAAAGDEVSREHARALVGDWIKLHSDPGGLAWEPDINARRIISWLSHSDLFIKGADGAYYDQVMRSLAMQIRYLRSSYSDAPDGLSRLTSLIALSFAGLCVDEKQPSPFARPKILIEELKRQVLVDGGHIDRNPNSLIELLLDLLPLRQCYIARDQKPPEELLGAIDRMMPMLRFFRLGNEGFARFNGMGPTPVESLAALIVHDDTRGKPVMHADKSGYCRLQSGKSVVIVDAGRPPPIALSGDAHAGCLSFEMHTGSHPLIVNCGVTAREDWEWRTVARATAAHSTLTVCDTSSSQFVGGASSVDGGNQPALSGPVNVQAELTEKKGEMELRASHDGYDTRYGLTHIRRIALSATGDSLAGTDELIAPHGLKGLARENNGEFAIRFHLHPEARAELSQDRRTAIIGLPDQDGWALSLAQGILSLDESVYLADAKGPRRTSQIVIYGFMGNAGEVSIGWTLERLTEPSSKETLEQPEEETGDLPLSG